ncbi:uncharacterized protein LOC143809129 isoform X2 [Ranitomeya variabilis]
MVEKREILNSTMIPVPDAIDEVVNMGPDEDAVTAPDRNHKAPRGPLAEKRDKLKNIKLPPGRVRDIVAKYTAYQNAIINSDKHQEDEKHIPPPRPVLRTTCEHCFVEFKARLSQNRQ